MSLEYKFTEREKLKDIQTYILDDSARSTNYFRVSDVPQVLQKGKNLLRITAHPTNLVEGSLVYIDIRDSNGDPIYYEIPDFLENDKSRIISIWVYHDKDIDNTPNGEATITLLGIATKDLQGNTLPPSQQGKINVKWQTTVNVDRDRNNSSEIIFDANSLGVPSVIVSQSVEPYQNQPQTGDGLILTSKTGKARYQYRGNTALLFSTDGQTFDNDVLRGEVIINNFTTPAVPIATTQNPLSSTFFSSSIQGIITSGTGYTDVVKLKTPFTSSFTNLTNNTHTYTDVAELDYEIKYFQTGSNVVTQNTRNFVNLTISNIDPIVGVVDKVKILQKSDGLPGNFEFLNEVQIEFKKSVNVTVPISSENLDDPKILKLLYLNAAGAISRTETITTPFVFDGDGVYIGGTNNLISGSIFISNSQNTGIEIGGASSGFIRSVGYNGITSASLGKAPGGFVIYSGSGNLQFGEDVLPGVGMEFVGDLDERHLVFNTANGGILDIKTDKFFIGNLNEQYISGSDGNIEISSSIFHLDPKANGGEGALTIGANATILADLTVDNLRTPAQIGGVASTETNSSSSIKADGFARFVSASIGGWGITTSSIEGGNLIMKPEGILQTKDFASGLKGWKISSEGNGTAEFENVRIRGTLRTTTFEKESVNAVGGQLWVANSTTITGSVTDTETTMSVKNASGFSQGEILIIKKVDNTGFQTEYVLLDSASIDSDGSSEDETYGRIMVQRAYGNGTEGDFVGDLASSSQTYEDGQVIVSTGKLNTGYIKMNANPNDANTPYMDIVERTGSGLYDVALKTRIGDLSGLANSSYVFGNPNPGYGLATDNVFLQGGIIAKTGSIGGIEMHDNKLFTGTGTHGNSNTGFYVDSASAFSLGEKLVWNPTTEALTVRGSIQLSDGTDVGTAISNISSPTGSRTVSMTADSYVVTFDSFGEEAPSGQTITLSATTQSFGDATAYYEFYQGASLQGSRSTVSTFSVDTTLEKPTAITPKTYAVNVFTQSVDGTSVASDNLTLFGIQPGSDGVDSVTAFLTNESHTFAADSAGVITSLVGGSTDMIVFEGVTNTTSAYTINSTSTTSVSSSVSSNTVTITSMGHDSGSVIITAVSASGESGEVSLSKTMSLSKAIAGQDGDNGTPGTHGDNAKTLIGSVDSQIFAFDDSTDNSATPGAINFAFSQQNLNDVITSSDITITTADSNTVTNFSFDSNSVGGDTNQKSGIVSGSVSYTGGFSSGGLNGAKTSLPLTISCTNDSLTDSVTVFKVEGGSDGAGGVDAVTAFLTNESHTLPSLNDGSVVSFAGAVTDMEVFEGTTNKNSVYTFSRTSSTSVSSSISDNTITITSMAHDSGSVIITAVSASGESGEVSLSKTMTLSKSKQGTAGLPGAAAKLLTLSLDSQIFAFPSASSSTPEDNDILIIVNQQNLSGTIDGGDITIKDSGGLTLVDPTFVADVTSGTGQVSGSLTFSGNVGGDKTKLPLTIEVAKDGLEDTIKIFKIDGGNEGQDAVTAFLTNESHTFAADSTGAIAVFTGGSTDMEVFEGITNKTSVYTFTKTDGAGVTSAVSGNTVTISAMTADNASITINASSGSVSIDKAMSLVKSRQGPDGSDGTSAKLLIGSLDSQVMSFDDASDTTATPTSIEFSFQQQNLSGSAGYLTLQSTDITVAYVGGTITNFTFDNNDVSNGTGIVSGSISFTGNTDAGGMGGDKSKFPIIITATKDGLNDTVKIFKVEGGVDGTDATNVLLSNDSHTLAAYSTGGIISFTGADTDVTVFEGIVDKTSEYTISRTNGIGVTTTLSGDNIAVTAMNHDSGSVTINASSGSVSIDKIMSITKARQGADGDTFVDTSITTTINLTTLSVDDTLTFTADTGLAWTAGLTAVLSNDSSNFINGTVNSYNSANGSMSLNVDTITGAGSYTTWSLNVGGVAGPQGTAGDNAKTVVVGAASQIFVKAQNGTLSPSSIVITANGQNLTANGAWSTTAGTLTNDSVSTSGGSATITNNNFVDNMVVTYTANSADGSVADSVTIKELDEGSGTVAVLLSNESHTLPASSAGVVSDYAGSGTQIDVYEGATQLDYDGNGTTNGHWTVTSKTVGPSTVMMTAGGTSESGDSAVIADHSGYTTTGNVVTVTYLIDGKTANGTDFSITKVQTISKSSEGADGTPGDNAKLLSISATSQTFAFDTSLDETATPSTIAISVNAQNITGTVSNGDILITPNDSSTIATPTLSGGSFDLVFDNGATAAAGKVVSKSQLPLTITVSKDSQSDTITIFKVEGGTSGEDAYTVFLTNESHTFPAAANGDVGSGDLAAGATDVKIFKGTTQLTNDNTSTYNANSYRAVASVSGITMNSTKPGSDRRFTPTAVTGDSGTATITITDNQTGTVFTKTYTFSKSKEGAVGAEGSDSKTVSLQAETNVVTYDADGVTPSPSSTITLTASSQNFTDGYFKFTGDGLTDETTYIDGDSANQDTFSWAVPASYFSAPQTIRVGVSEANQSELTFDTVTIAAIKPGLGGEDAVTAFLTSEADVVPAAYNGDVSSFGGSGTTMKVFEGITDKTSLYAYALVNTTTGLTAALSTNVLSISGLTPDSGSTDIRATSGSVTIDKTYSIAKSLAGAQGDQGANNQDFSFLDASLSGVQGTLAAGLLMNSNVFGYHGAIGSGVTAALSDFTSFLDSSGNFYLGGNSSGASDPSGGYFAWNNTDKSLLISGSNANIEVDKFLLGSGTSQYISGSNGNVEIAGDVTFRGRPDNGDGNVIFFDDFSQYSTIADTDGGNVPKNDGTGAGWYWPNAGETSLVTDTDCISGKSLVLGNNAGDDEARLLSNQLIPFNESSLYEVEVRIKRTAGASDTYAYVGIAGMQSDGTTKVGYGGGNDTSGHYITLQQNNLGSNSGTGYFQIFKGYIKGTGTDHHFHDSKTDPANARVEILNGYIRAYLLLNNNDTNGITHVDYIKIKEFTSGGTSRISGDSITTGTLKSNNLDGTNGSEFRLDDGTFKLGGTTSPKLEWDGTTLAVKGNIEVEGGGFGSGAGELFGNPTGHLLRNDGRPGGWRAGYSNGDTSTIKSTDLGDGNGKIVELSSTSDNTIGMVSHAFPIEVQQNYKIRLEAKADEGDLNGFYIRIYEYDSELPAGKDSISHNSNPLLSTPTSEQEVQEDTRQNTPTFYADDGVTELPTENAAITTSYVSYNGTYTPHPAAKYFSVVILNWDGMAPTATKLFLKSMNVRKVSQGTTITGEGISTGLIQSVNINADSGSRIDLDDGSMIMGGTGNPGFQITEEGFVTATNLVEKTVTLTVANSGSYYETYSTNKTRIILDGSLGGDITMNMTLNVAPPYVIHDIQFPSNAGADEIAKLELTILDDGVQFDDVAIFSGWSSFAGNKLTLL